MAVKEKHLIRIRNLMNSFKNLIDPLAESYKKEKSDLELYLSNMRGKWTDEYIKEYSANWQPEKDYNNEVNKNRKIIKESIDKEFNAIRKEADHFFNESPNSDFVNHVVALRLTGAMLSENEQRLLEKRIANYQESKLFDSLIMGIDEKNKADAVSKGGTDAMRSLIADANKPKKIIDIDATYNEIDHLESRCNDVLNTYLGEGMELYELVGKPNGIPNYASASAGNFFRNGDITHLGETLKSIDIFVKPVEPLSNAELDIVDKFVDPTLKYSVKEHVLEASKNPQIRELLLRDDRYCDLVPEELETA